MIEVHELTKRYCGAVAVDGLSFAVRPGRVTGFLGPNGAGKSTTMRVILGLDSPTSGWATVNGQPYQRLSRPLNQAGALLDAGAVHCGRTARDHLRAVAASNGIGARRVTEVLGLVGLDGVAGRRVRGFSLGMKQRLGIAAALLGDPPVLMFDEPVNGLDPEGIHWIRGLLKSLAAEGRTVFVSSHLMSEMALTAEHLIVIGRGRLVADAAIEEFVRQSSRSDVLVRSPAGGALAGLLSQQGGDGHRENGRRTRRDRPGRRRDRRPGPRARHHPARAHPQARLAGGGVHGTHPGQRGLPRRPARRYTEGCLTMTTTAIVAVPARARDVLASEWIKFRSVRSTYLTLLLAAVAAVSIGYLVTHSDATHWSTMTAQARAAFDPVGDSFTGLGIAQLAFGALGVLAISSEHTTGLIRTTFASAPRRRAVIAGKAAVVGTVSLLAGELIAFATFFTAQHLNVALAHPGALRGVLAAGFYLAVMAWVGLGLGTVIRHTAGAIIAMVGVVFLLPTIIGALPAPWNINVGKFTLNLAAQQTIAQHPHPGYFSPGPSFLIVAAYAAAAIAAAAFMITRRDA